MCTRILNNIDISNVTTARNMDWEFHLDATLLITPSGGEAFGMDEAQRKKARICRSKVLKWHVKYASITTLLGDKGNGFGYCDGMNEKGFVANVLYDRNCTFHRGRLEEKQRGLNILRWGQFMLDQFSSVEEAVNYFSSEASDEEICLFGARVPGDPRTPAFVHATISDRFGDSAILKIHKGKPLIYHHRDYTVVTDEPDYQATRSLDLYWNYRWDVFDSARSKLDFTAPGGHTSVQRFARASYYRLLQNPDEINVDRVAQVAAMASPCKIPQGFELPNKHSNEDLAEKDSDITFNTFTLWTNISDSKNGRYYLQSSQSIQTIWVEFPKSFEQAQSLCLDAAFRAAQVMGDVTKKMTPVVSNPLHTA